MKQSKKNLAFHLSENGLNWLLLGASFILLGGSLFWGFQAMQVTAEKKTAVNEGSSEEGPKQPPLLKLNTSHHRQGEIIEVNPGQIGKENPFQ